MRDGDANVVVMDDGDVNAHVPDTNLSAKVTAGAMHDAVGRAPLGTSA